MVPFARALDLLALGEDSAALLGIDAARARRWLLLASSLLVGAAVSVAGLVGFVGLVVPHALRLALGPDHRLLVPASALAGAAFLVALRHAGAQRARRPRAAGRRAHRARRRAPLPAAAAPHAGARAALVSGRPPSLARRRARLARRRPVLAGLDLELAAGELLLLAGRNGAGKTTLLRAAAGLVRPGAGRVELGGRPLADFSRRELARAARLRPAGGRQRPSRSRRASSCCSAAPRTSGWLAFESKADVAAAEAALARLGLEALADRSVLELSGGERQLVQLARALAQDAPLLLLDEPTAHLDLAHRALVLGCLRELAREGRAVLVVSHDLAAAGYCEPGRAAGGRADPRGGRARRGAPSRRLRAAFGVEARCCTAGRAPMPGCLGASLAPLAARWLRPAC